MEVYDQKVYELWQKLYPEIELYVKAQISPNDVEDILQEVSIIFFGKYDHIIKETNNEKEYSDFRSWVYRTTTYEILNLRRRNNRRTHLDIERCFDIGSRFDEIEDATYKIALQQILSNMNKKDKNLLSLKVFDALTFKEISENTGKTVDSLSSQYQRLKKKIEKHLKKFD